MVVSAAHFKDITNGYERRTDGLWVHTGRLIVKGGPVDLPDGSIGTAELAANATQQQIGAYFGPTTFSTTAGGYVLTPITTGTIACSGALCRIEFSSAFGHSVASGAFYTGISLDGATIYNLSLTNAPAANYIVAVAWVLYYTPPAGAHTFTVHVLNASGGTLGISQNISSALYVTEQKR